MILKKYIRNGLLCAVLLTVTYCSYRFASVEEFPTVAETGITPFNLDLELTSFRYSCRNMDSLNIRIELLKEDKEGNLTFEITPRYDKEIQWGKLTPLIAFVMRNEANYIKRIASLKAYRLRTDQRNTIEIEKPEENGIVCLGCFLQDDVYRYSKDKKHNLIFYQKTIYGNQKENIR